MKDNRDLIVDEPEAEKHTYGQILKSSAVFGGSSVLNILIRIVRTKAMALLLGPGGFGLMSLYGSIADLSQNIAGMGINSSGVRQIAEAAGSGKAERIAQTVAVLRRTSFFLGLLGAVLLAIFSKQISILTFGSDQHTTAVMLLSIAVFFSSVSAGQSALIQGMRRISDLSMMGVLTSILGTIISISLIYLYGENGVALALVGTAAVGIIISWWFSRKILIHSIEMTYSQVRQEAASLLKLGVVFMLTAFLTTGAAYAVNTMVLRMVSLEGTGYYQTAWILGGLYIGFILDAMGADFYPRLTAVARDNAKCNRIVNEQAHVSLLLAGPGVMATLAFTPIVITLFYSAKFSGAVEIMRWFCLGMALRVITWPMGFILVAKGERALFLGVDLAWSIANVGLSWIFLMYFGLKGAGIAFFGSYIFYGLILYPIVRKVSGFYFSAANIRTGLIFISSMIVVISGFYFLPYWAATAIGILATLSSSVYSIQVLLNLVSLDWIPRPIMRWLVRFGILNS
ncbi:MAG TPA: O-antigen translocase [Candidatus Methylomirabilis sp.]|nr:O-antigen translocase [Candidatus Methylomirabilis sp.]